MFIILRIINCINVHFKKRYLHTHVLCSIIHKSQEGEATQCPLIDERINIMWCIHTIEYYPALKGKEIVPCYNTDES